MKDELQAAIAQLGVFGAEALADGLPETHAKTLEVIEGLVPILVRAELLEELWLAAKVNHVSRLEITEHPENYEAFRKFTRAGLELDKVCKRAADTDGQ